MDVFFQGVEVTVMGFIVVIAVLAFICFVLMIFNFIANLENKKATNTEDLSKYKVGQNVFHKRFGKGTITNLEQEADDIKVDIEFEKFGHKRLMAKFAGLEIID